mmetsp:Transcript_23054/g.74177  ORF Transcript_23054/g.74177 Transcript_23054/m.74177 type:complete len:581 (+) Transcript_23054:103-1845(+)
MSRTTLALLLLASARSEVVVDTARGPVIGDVVAGVRVFKSIPFAEAERWQPPRPVPAWTEPLDARPTASACLQDGYGSEDCLFLYVYAPEEEEETREKTSKLLLPVMVFVHGGGLQSGDGYQLGTFDGTILAVSSGVVVVSVQYRLGLLGFAAVDHDEGVGNLGLLDQRAAFEWVRDNVRHFGGDPSRVTIFGESAGAISICFHLVSPQSRGLFHAAIMQSGSCEMQVQTLAAGKRYLESYETNRLGGGDLATAPLELLVWPLQADDNATKLPFSPYAGAPAFPWCVTIDGRQLTDTPHELLSSNVEVPVLLGFNKDEFQYASTSLRGDALADVPFVNMLPRVIPEILSDLSGITPYYDDETILSILSHFTAAPPQKLAPLLPLYSQHSESSVAKLSAMMVDSTPAAGGFAKRGYGGWIGPCSSLDIASRLPRGAYVYHFSRSAGWPTTAHAAELPYVFQHCLYSYRGVGLCQGRLGQEAQTERDLASFIGGYWTTFAKTAGDPNERAKNSSSAVPFWPPYTSQKKIMHLDLPLVAGPVDPDQAARCAAWKDALRPPTTPHEPSEQDQQSLKGQPPGVEL